MKITMVFILCVLTFGGLVSCSEEEYELRWDNQNATFVEDITWVSGGQEDTKWSGVTASGTKTSFKKVSGKNGNGECVDSNGLPADILLPGDVKATTLSEGSNELTITDVQTK